jgi:MFS family permease
VAVLALGAALGAAQVLVLAYTEVLQVPGGAALVYFVNSGASLVGAIVVGGMTWRRPARTRFSIALLGYGIGLLPSALVTSYWPFVAASVVSGMAIAPTFVQANAMVADETPARIRTAAFALLASATGLGIALGAAAAGQAVAVLGGDEARRILVPLALTCVAAAVVVDVAHRRGAAIGPIAPTLAPEDEAPHVPAPAPPPSVPTGPHDARGAPDTDARDVDPRAAERGP